MQFIRRILSEVGIYWRTEMDDVRGLDTYIFADSQLHYRFDVHLTYCEPSGLFNGAAESVWDVRTWHNIATGTVTTRDYNYRTASTPMDATVSVRSDAVTTGEHYRYAAPYREAGDDASPEPETESEAFWARLHHERELNKSATKFSPVAAFFGGILTASVLSIAAFSFMPKLFSHPGEVALTNSLAALPASMPLPVVAQLHLDAPSWLKSSDAYAEKVNSRLNELSMLPPYWPLQYATQLVEQTRHLYPNSELSMKISKVWQSKPVANSLPNASINGWYKGFSELQRLQDRLNQLDEKKGKYMTVSELKTAVFSISQAFSNSVPVEELIRQIQASPQNQPFSRDLLNRVDLQLSQLNNSYLLATLGNTE